MLAIGQGAIGTIDGRLRWIQADLASPGWLEELGETQVDAVLSTTALHWLPPEPLARLYRDLGRQLRPGLVLNGDHLDFDPASPTLARLSLRVREEQWTDAAFAARGIETAEQWGDVWPRNLRSHRRSPSGPGASPASRPGRTTRLRRPRGGAARRRLPRGGHDLTGAREPRGASRAAGTGQPSQQLAADQDFTWRRAERTPSARRLRPLAQHPGLAEGQLRHRLTDPNLDRLPGQGCVTSH